jgi:type II secretory pathway component PulJ
MAKTTKRKTMHRAPENSLERLRRETKARLQREVRLEKQIAALARQLERLVPRRHADLRALANFILERYSNGTHTIREPERDDERLELAEA